jgi:hypothetical protein
VVVARAILVVFAVALSHLMLQLITILNRCHRFPGFVYQKARFRSDHKSIKIAMRPRKGSKAICSRCHQPTPGYDQLIERRFEFIPFWGFLVFPLYSMRRVACRRCHAVVVEEVPWAVRGHPFDHRGLRREQRLRSQCIRGIITGREVEQDLVSQTGEGNR